jgi:hypothetical protein
MKIKHKNENICIFCIYVCHKKQSVNQTQYNTTQRKQRLIIIIDQAGQIFIRHGKIQSFKIN